MQPLGVFCICRFTNYVDREHEFVRDACHLAEGLSASLPSVSHSMVFSVTRPAAMCQCDFKQQVSFKRSP